MMAAVKQKKKDVQRMSMAELRDHAWQGHEDHSDEATRSYVDRLIDLELERRLDLVHRRPGWHPSSPGFGDGTGASAVAIDAMFLAYEKGISNSYWHSHAQKVLSKLPDRRLLALLIKAAKMDSRLEGPWCAKWDQIAASLSPYAQMLGWPAAGTTETCEKIVDREVARDHRNSAHVFPMRPEDEEREMERREAAKMPRIERTVTKERKPLFKDGESLRKAARDARVELILLAKAGVA